MTRLPLLSSSQDHSVLVALVAGVIYLLALYALARRGGYEFAADTTEQVALYALWIGLGHLLLASLPVYLLVQYGYLAPLVAFLGIAGYVIAVEVGGAADSPLAIYGMFWLVPLAMILGVAGLEYAARTTILP